MHGFCTVFCTVSRDAMGYSDLQNTAKGAEIAGRKITMLCTKNDVNSKLLKSECSARWALFNQRGQGFEFPRAHQNPTKNRKIPRGIFRFLELCTLLHTFCTPAGKLCFSLHCLHSVHRERFFPYFFQANSRRVNSRRCSGSSVGQLSASLRG